MGLADYTIPTHEVSLPPANGKPNSITVRGLSFSDFVYLGNSYGPQVALVFGKFMGGDKISEDEVKAALLALLPDLGDLPGAVIALASSDNYAADPLLTKIAARLPLPVQFEALKSIFILTVESESQLKKFAESILTMFTATSGLVSGMRLPVSGDGSGGFDGASLPS